VRYDIPVETEFVCNVCGSPNRVPAGPLDRERPGCAACGSNVRMRGLLHALSQELFGANLTVPEFPRVKSLRGLGLSDSTQYADTLAAKLDYRNTYFHREPRFDITEVDEAECGRYDFVLASEVFEHVAPPAGRAFANAFRLLREGGVLVFTVPYSLDAATVEHFPALREHGLARVGGRTVLVNRTAQGEVQVFENLAFHISFGGEALEMREFSESALKTALAAAGFSEVRICSDNYAPFGIAHAEACSLPIAARKGAYGLSRAAAGDIIGEWRGLKQKFDADMRRLGKSWWFRIGRKMGWL
jgi:SAM-dependent methyltransferase